MCIFPTIALSISNGFRRRTVCLGQAIDAAKNSDAIVAFVGLSPNLEGEEMNVHVDGFDGGDRTSIELPAAQEHLLEALGATGKPLIVVLTAGSALAVPWAKEHADALLAAWYPGEEGGDAIAETLAGKNNPAGRLPVTFYRSTADLPAFTDYSMKNRTYRYFKGDVMYPFGFGLSYSRFSYRAADAEHDCNPRRRFCHGDSRSAQRRARAMAMKSRSFTSCLRKPLFHRTWSWKGFREFICARAKCDACSSRSRRGS